MTIAESLDHFVVPVDDLIAAEEFYVRVFGGRITKRNGLNVRQRKRGAVPHTFIQIGGKRMGVYLQSVERPQPTGARGLPTYSFTTTAQGLEAVMNDLNELGSRFDGPVQNAFPFLDQSLFFTDPAGNYYAVFTRKGSNEDSTNTHERITGVGYIELEAPDVSASINFYAKVLGFDVQSRSQGSRQAILKMARRRRLAGRCDGILRR
jgi:catechol 2,3-dioxygenase-like lactoylglutathione lyase family enzyme